MWLSINKEALENNCEKNIFKEEEKRKKIEKEREERNRSIVSFFLLSISCGKYPIFLMKIEGKVWEYIYIYRPIHAKSQIFFN